MKLVKVLWKRWLVIARIIGNFQGQVILTLFYFFLIWPLGIVFSLFADPFRLRSGQALRKTNFEKWEHPKESLEEARRQY